MPNVDRWIAGILIAGIGLYGLVVASRAHEHTTYYIGIAIFVASLVFNFWQINQAFKTPPTSRQTHHPTGNPAA